MNSVGLKKSVTNYFNFVAPKILTDFSNESAKIGHDRNTSNY
jgi:hypothetical protein